MARIVLLTNSSDIARYFANKVAGAIDLHRIVIHQERGKKNVSRPPVRPTLMQKAKGRLARQVRRVWLRWSADSLWVTYGERVAQLENKLDAEARERYLKGIDDIVDYPCASVHFDVNGARCLDYVRGLEPDVFLVFGTPILKPQILEVPRLGALNVHTSVLPRYRGTMVEFWQLYHRDYDHVGVTVHFADPGVHTGDIVLQKRNLVEEGDHFYSVRYRNILAAIELAPQAVRTLVNGSVRRLKQPPSDQETFRSHMVTLQKKVELYRRFGLL